MTNLMTQRQPLYQMIAGALLAIANCEKTGNQEAQVSHHERIEKLVSNYLPSGSGFDAGTSLNFDLSKPDRLVFDTSFHHMNDGGYYSGWTQHQVIVKPSLALDLDLRITGRDRNDLKEYMYETFEYHLTVQYPLYDQEAA